MTACLRKIRQRDLTFEHRHGGTGHEYRTAFACPGHHELAAPRFNRYALRIEYVARDTRDDRRAGARAACERLTRAALVHAQAHAPAIDDLQKTGVDPARETRMPLDQRSVGLDGRRIDVAHDPTSPWCG